MYISCSVMIIQYRAYLFHSKCRAQAVPHSVRVQTVAYAIIAQVILICSLVQIISYAVLLLAACGEVIELEVLPKDTSGLWRTAVNRQWKIQK